MFRNVSEHFALLNAALVFSLWIFYVMCKDVECLQQGSLIVSKEIKLPPLSVCDGFIRKKKDSTVNWLCQVKKKVVFCEF